MNQNKIEFIKALFEELNNQVNYTVLRGYDKIPNQITGDIDLLIDKKEYKKFLNILESLIIQYELNEIKRIDRHYVRMFRLFHIEVGASYGLKIDIHFGEMWRGATYLTANNILEKKIAYKNIFIPSYEDQVAINLFQGLLGMGYVTEKRQNQLQNILPKVDDEKLLNLLAELTTKSISENLMTSLKNKDFVSINKQVKRIRKIVFIEALSNRPLTTSIDFSLFILKNMKYKIIYPGAFIALIGPDGAGKSTAINNLTSILDQVIINGNSKVIPWKPAYLMRLAELKKDKSLDSLPKSVKKRHIPNKFSSFLRFSYYTLDYILGHLIQNRKILTSEGYIVYDRYFYDYLIQPPERSFINMPRWIKNIFSFFIPMPQVIIYFKATPSVLFSRKQEETMEELKELVRLYDNYVSDNDNIITIDATQSPEDVEINILNEIVKTYVK